MNFKKGLLIIVVFVSFGVNAFARDPDRFDTFILFDDVKLKISQTNSYIELADKYRHSSWLTLDNKTNYEMEVTVSYTITRWRLDMKNETTEQYLRKTIKLKPHGSFQVDAFGISYDGYGVGHARLNFIELVHYRVIQKNYEIQ